ncbi:hypothetical protein HYPSUDRAFT_66109 [Hypholoma sublateritium FD-334 SS-4]|uniref:Uncharacterized protein n=1 Tax=Hypholoma sublateritium (strain FD-334 SS-4) TaxID=945553 RepID=A0A0D2PW70_HYPSF|nr:hypothetical protein HYPSUDRAFT_66109 [Hypholoma sublateritium FD-334 SS-4]
MSSKCQQYSHICMGYFHVRSVSDPRCALLPRSIFSALSSLGQQFSDCLSVPPIDVWRQ